MKWRWLLLDYADPALGLNWRQRVRLVWRETAPEHTSPEARRGSRLFYLSLIGIVCLTTVPWFFYLMQTTRSVHGVFVLLWLGVTCIAIYAGSAIAYGLFCRREHINALRLDGCDLCLNCGYWLRGLNEDVKRCPECGTEREKLPEVKT